MGSDGLSSTPNSSSAPLVMRAGSTVEQPTKAVAKPSKEMKAGSAKTTSLPFGPKLIEDEWPDKKMGPSTQGVGQSLFHGIIDISDDDEASNEIAKVKKVSGSRKAGDFTKGQWSYENNLKKAKVGQAAQIISCDDEYYTVKTQHSSRVSTDSEEEVKENASRRYPTRPRKSESENKQDKSSFDMNSIVVLSEDEEDIDGVDVLESNLQKTNLEYIDEKHMDAFSVRSANIKGGKRNRVPKIITIDDEDSYIDNAPIYTPKLRKSESDKKEDKSSYDLYKTSSEDEEDDDGSESEGESLGGFIVDGSESVSNYDSESGDSDDEYEDVLNEYRVTMEKIGRKKNSNYNWASEADMLSDFAKDPELCMSAVCAIYRRQTGDKKEDKVTKYQNERGFSQSDASKGSTLAEFLMDGDPDGDLKKTVEELLEYDPNGIKQCRKLAFKYSKQLFEIYQNQEDPYFPPQR